MGRAQTLAEVIAILKEHEGFFRGKGITRLAVFGSIARGDARSDSDVDLVIDVDPEAKFSLLTLCGVQNGASDLLGREVDLVMRRSVKPGILPAIERDEADVFRA
ncbi:nucleotidyltransferase [Paramagnetospirillum caucaseum]|uniref:Nucleotidyltransferase n=1 Tax=Paramagnetospirillum caucaseum TaxID=1244869 RepID=M3A8Y4_9PROT|nr:nucleotidyltransferase family protein [Paramagnetospirillum caucaseum]EME68964.1 nucleotidyltransferase [Paramagnetospirillum caucaseum]